MNRSRALLLVACAALAGGSTTAASPTARPKLQAVDLHPLVVRGTSFRSYERVRLILAADVAADRVLKASATGRFVTRFRTVSVGRCEGFVLQAFGSRGSRATLERLSPDCMDP